MTAGEASGIPVRRPVQVAARRGVGAGSLLGSVGAVFSFFLIAEFEFIVVALPLTVAGLARGLAHLHRVRTGEATDRTGTAVGLAVSTLGLVFCVAGVVVASVT